MKLLVMLLTFQHLLLLGVLSFSPSQEIGLNPDANISRCGGIMNKLDIQDSKN
jgi:hypothetical protein